jgi:uncharacterized SAM-binding protein YcdF (DUF218 family)
VEHSSFDEYEATLEIPREMPIPALSDEEVGLITRMTFFPSDPRPSDLFFLFGTHQCDWKGVADLYRSGFFPKIMLPGRVGPTLFSEDKPISHHMRDHLLAAGLPVEVMMLEDRSMNTWEDVSLSLPILEGHGIHPSSIVFGAKAHHSGRCHLTLKKFFPDVPISAFTWPARYGQTLVERDFWMETDVARSRVYGEYRRILAYSAKGDIAPFDPNLAAPAVS